MFIQRFFISFVFLCYTLSVYATPTQRFLNHHPLEEILTYQKENFSESVPYLLEIASHEDEDSFFGYHAISQHSRLFQDIVQVVFEDVLNISIPHNFYFLRIPGSQEWNWQNGKEQFLNHFGKPLVSNETKKLIILKFLETLETELNLPIAKQTLSESDISILWKYFEEHIYSMYQLEWINTAKKYALPEPIKLEESSAHKNLSEVTLLIAHKTTDPQKAAIAIQGWIENNFKQFYEYKLHPQEFKQLQNELHNFFEDTMAPQNNLLVSMNLSIFGNYKSNGCFSAGIFLANESVLGGDSRLEKILQNFFEQIGLDPQLANQLWHEGQQILAKKNNKSGCLLQFFDLSKFTNQKPFYLVNKDAYVSFKWGVPLIELEPSDYISGVYLLQDAEKKDLELRLVLNNRTNLNPFSSIRMVRYDFLTPDDQEDIKSALKNLIKNAPVDKTKALEYVKMLEKLWN